MNYSCFRLHKLFAGTAVCLLFDLTAFRSIAQFYKPLI